MAYLEAQGDDIGATWRREWVEEQQPGTGKTLGTVSIRSNSDGVYHVAVDALLEPSCNVIDIWPNEMMKVWPNEMMKEWPDDMSNIWTEEGANWGNICDSMKNMEEQSKAKVAMAEKAKAEEMEEQKKMEEQPFDFKRNFGPKQSYELVFGSGTCADGPPLLGLEAKSDYSIHIHSGYDAFPINPDPRLTPQTVLDILDAMNSEDSDSVDTMNSEDSEPVTVWVMAEPAGEAVGKVRDVRVGEEFATPTPIACGTFEVPPKKKKLEAEIEPFDLDDLGAKKAVIDKTGKSDILIEGKGEVEATVEGKGSYPVTGKISLELKDDKVFKLKYELKGLPKNCVECEIHIHENGDCNDPCAGHFYNYCLGIDDPWGKEWRTVYTSDADGIAEGHFYVRDGYSFAQHINLVVDVHNDLRDNKKHSDMSPVCAIAPPAIPPPPAIPAVNAMFGENPMGGVGARVGCGVLLWPHRA